MKGVVLAGGRGSRLRPITYSMAKQLVPVANKPVIRYGLEDLVDAGVIDIGIVISPHTGNEIRAVVETLAEEIGFTPTFIVQDEPLGLAHALLVALPFVDGEDCLMYLGDNLVKGGVADVARDFAENDPNCQIMLSSVPNPSAFGVADVAPDGSVRRLVEKPSVPPSDLALVGVYLFDATIAEAVRAIEPSARGELEITDAIQYLIDTGRTVRHSVVSGWWKDTGTKEDLLAAQHLVIAELSRNIEGEVIDSEVQGAIHVGANSRVADSEIVGPVVIGEGVTVTRSRIGPETSIGDECVITDSTIERSIVMGGSRVAGWWLRASIIGRGTTLRSTAPQAFAEMMLGEHSEITES